MGPESSLALEPKQDAGSHRQPGLIMMMRPAGVMADANTRVRERRPRRKRRLRPTKHKYLPLLCSVALMA